MSILDYQYQGDDGSDLLTGSDFPMIQLISAVDMKALKKGSDSVDDVAGFFIADDQIDEVARGVLMEQGWKADQRTPQSGKTFDCISNTNPEFIYVAHRFRWHDGGGQLQIMVLVSGCEVLGPFVLTLRKTTAMAFAGVAKDTGNIYTPAQIKGYSDERVCQYRSILEHMRVVRQAAYKAMKENNSDAKPLPLYAFKMPIGFPQVNGKPHTINVGKNGASTQISLPQLMGVPQDEDEVTIELLDELFLGGDTIAAIEQLRQEHEGWVRSWDKGVETASDDDDDDDEITDEDLDGFED